MQPWASITTHAGSHLLKSKEGHPPAPGTDVTDVVVYPDAAAVVAVNEWKQLRTNMINTYIQYQRRTRHHGLLILSL